MFHELTMKIDGGGTREHLDSIIRGWLMERIGTFYFDQERQKMFEVFGLTPDPAKELAEKIEKEFKFGVCLSERIAKLAIDAVKGEK